MVQKFVHDKRYIDCVSWCFRFSKHWPRWPACWPLCWPTWVPAHASLSTSEAWPLTSCLSYWTSCSPPYVRSVRSCLCVRVCVKRDLLSMMYAYCCLVHILGFRFVKSLFCVFYDYVDIWQKVNNRKKEKEKNFFKKSNKTRNSFVERFSQALLQARLKVDPLTLWNPDSAMTASASEFDSTR